MPACRVLLTSRGWRVMIAAMPPPNAYTAQINARINANEPNTSTGILRLSPGQAGPLHCALRRVACRGEWQRVPPGCRFVLRRALRLDVFGDETAIRRAALDQRLRLINESIRQWVTARHNSPEATSLPLAAQNPRARRNGECCRAPPFRQRESGAPVRALKSLKFRNGVVISLAFAVAQPRQEAIETTITPIPIPNFACFFTAYSYACSRIHALVDSITAAATARWPKDSYKPGPTGHRMAVP